MTAGPVAAQEVASDEPWSVIRLIRWSAGYLEGKGIASGQARLDAEHLLAHALSTERLQLYLDFDRPLTPGELAAYKPLLLRRAAREPLQYIVGRAAFRELDLSVDPRVLIPRPETEELVDAVLGWARERAGVPERSAPSERRSAPLPWSEEAGEGPAPAVPEDRPAEAGAGPPPGTRTLTALDVGTGSGCIALSLVLEGPFERVVATDASAGALELARMNAGEAGLAERVDFREGSLYEPSGEERFDVVVSNPPYVAEGDAGSLEPEVRDHEPAGALFAGADGLAVVAALVEGAGEHLRPGGLLALEVGLGQAEGVADRIDGTGAFHAVEVRRDLQGRQRIVLAERRT